MLLCASGADVAAARSAAEAVAAPVQVLDATALPDSGAALAAAGLAAPGEVWVIRPDAHTAAVLHDPGRAEIVADWISIGPRLMCTGSSISSPADPVK